MRREISQQILGIASHIADTHISFDKFIQDVTAAHIGLLDSTKELESVVELLIRSGHEGPAKRLEQVQADIEFAMETFRVLDELYHTGKLKYGPRAPQARQMHQMHPTQTTRDLGSSQERPLPSRPTRSLNW